MHRSQVGVRVGEGWINDSAEAVCGQRYRLVGAPRARLAMNGEVVSRFANCQ